jgi:hypothetical protein
MSLPEPARLPRPCRHAFVALASCLAATGIGAAETVVVTGSVLQRVIEEAPFAISVVEGDTLRRAGPPINLSESMARVDKLFDRAYAGSVIVNESNGRFFETGAPRSGLLALRWVNAPSRPLNAL